MDASKLGQNPLEQITILTLVQSYLIIVGHITTWYSTGIHRARDDRSTAAPVKYFTSRTRTDAGMADPSVAHTFPSVCTDPPNEVMLVRAWTHCSARRSRSCRGLMRSGIIVKSLRYMIFSSISLIFFYCAIAAAGRFLLAAVVN